MNCVDCKVVLITKEGNRLLSVVYASDLKPVGPRCLKCYETRRKKIILDEKAVVIVRPRPV